ncbi:MAG TPA: hypothetical protein VM285_06300 [Polyangia bacterium]|nr:hypothetical protein [Polyangia bacterium]
MTEKHAPRLGDLLLSANLIDEIQLRVALQEQAETGERLGSALVHLGFIDEAVLAAFLSRQADLPCVNIQGLFIPADVLALIPKEIALEHSIIPIRRSGDVLYLAMADPFAEETREMAAEISGCNVVPMIAPEFRLKRSIDKFYSDAPEEPEEPRERLSVELQSLVDEMEADGSQNLALQVRDLAMKIDRLVGVVAELKDLIKARG